MRRFSAIVFFLLYLISTTEVSQLLKLPLILQHYHEHQAINKNISFLAFLDMHYMHGSPHDDDYDRDMQLPFKKADHHASISPVSVPNFAQIPVCTVLPAPSSDFNTPGEEGLYFQYDHSIFQPPRI